LWPYPSLEKYYNSLLLLLAGLFETTVQAYNKNKAEANVIASATEVRKALVDSLRNLFAFMPLQLQLTKSQELEQLIRQIDAELDRF
jgi:hypothetical protein